MSKVEVTDGDVQAAAILLAAEMGSSKVLVFDRYKDLLEGIVGSRQEVVEKLTPPPSENPIRVF